MSHAPRRWLIGVALTMLAGCASPPPPPAPLPPLRQTGASVTVDGLTIPLPDGEWRTVFSGKQSMAYVEASRAVVASVADGVIDRAVLVMRAELGEKDFFQPRRSCHSAEYFHSENAPLEHPHNGECWHVRAVNLGVAGNPHWLNQTFLEFAESNDLFAPTTMVGVRYIRYRGPVLLQVDYLWTPDVLVRRPAGGTWTPDDWTNATIAADAERRAVVDVLIRWGRDWYRRMAEMFPTG